MSEVGMAVQTKKPLPSHTDLTITAIPSYCHTVKRGMNRLALGLMSGTSGDGVSVALASFGKHSFKLLCYETFRYPKSLSEIILRGRSLTTPEISRVNIRLGEFFAEKILEFLRKCRVRASHIAVIGSPGQTIYHGPSDEPPNTFQIGEPAIVAERTGIPAVSDFRMRDLACGGEGAPLIPFFDQYFFGNSGLQALQNIGGIANVTVVGPSQKLIAFDTGPGNCLIDRAVRKVTGGRLRYDRFGRMAARGLVDIKAVREMAGHPYFRKKPPKSTGLELFNEYFIPQRLRSSRPEDLVATLTYFTAYTIALSYERFVPQRVREVIVSGGGSRNPLLMFHLRNLLFPIPVCSIETLGIPTQAKEPLAFAFYALRTLEAGRNHLPFAAGAKYPCVLGKIILAKNADGRD